MRPKELREKSGEELEELERQLVRDLAATRFKKGSGEIKDVHAVRKLKRDLARVKTIMKEMASVNEQSLGGGDK